MRTHFENYEEARIAAQDHANQTGLLLRLRKIREFGRVGYAIGFVPHQDKQFGRDSEGELVRPENTPQVPIPTGR